MSIIKDFAVIFTSRSDAEFVLDALIDETDLFDRACLYTFYNACLIPTDDGDRALGWSKEEICSSLIKCRMAPGFSEYYIDLPTPHPIKTIDPYSIIPLWENGNITEIAKRTFPITEGGDKCK